MCDGLATLKVEKTNATLGIPHSHKHSASEAQAMKDLHARYHDLSLNGGLDEAIEAEKVTLKAS
jgi:hypothetical protein